MAVDGHGLNKAERLSRKREEQSAEERKKALPLEKKFPGGVAAFDPFYFGLTGLSVERVVDIGRA